MGDHAATGKLWRRARGQKRGSCPLGRREGPSSWDDPFSPMTSDSFREAQFVDPPTLRFCLAMIPVDSLASRQAWKIRLALGVICVGAFLWIASLATPRYVSELLGNLGALVALLALACVSYAVKCPKCQSRVIFHAMTTATPMTWMQTALRSPCCPKCGFRYAPDS